ncbi:MAG: hypothetical protein Q8O04_00180 [Deltaproteobacteria bacterium]|nr:hypothetical protein [Deltaproteobacteria bacterium]
MAEVDNKQIDSSQIQKNFIEYLDTILKRAFDANPFGTLCSLLRVGGMSDASWDPFEESRTAFEDYNWLSQKAGSERNEIAALRVALLMYCQAIEMTAPHEILLNLMRCISGQSYIVGPFDHLKRRKKLFYEYIPPSAKRKFEEIKKLASSVDENKLTEIIDSFFDDRVRNAFSHSDYIITDEYFRWTEGGLAQQIDLDKLVEKINLCLQFFGCFMTRHKDWLKAFGNLKRFHKWPQYEVLEILTTDEEGVYGFNVHFSNGNKATYTRQKSGIRAINLTFDRDGSINFMVGNLDALEKVWKVNGHPVTDWDALEEKYNT